MSENLNLIAFALLHFCYILCPETLLSQEQFSWILLRIQKRCMNEGCEFYDNYLNVTVHLRKEHSKWNGKTRVSYYSLCTTDWKVCDIWIYLEYKKVKWKKYSINSTVYVIYLKFSSFLYLKSEKIKISINHSMEK